MNESIIGLIGALIGAVVTFLIGLFTLRYNHSHLYSNIVSTSRNEWINIWRQELSNFLTSCDILRIQNNDNNKDCKNSKNNKNNKDTKDDIPLLEKYYSAKYKILTRLNTNETLHNEVYLLINKIDYNKENMDDKEYFETKELLLEVARTLLKQEWERVKLEAKGRK